MSARPGGWVPGIGWVSLVRDLDDGCKFAYTTTENYQLNKTVSGWWRREAANRPVIVTRWADGSTPSPVESEGERVSVPLPEWEAMRDAETYRAALMLACVDGWADGAGAFEHYMDAARKAVGASR